jgi:hypothetical protein
MKEGCSKWEVSYYDWYHRIFDAIGEVLHKPISLRPGSTVGLYCSMFCICKVFALDESESVWLKNPVIMQHAEDQIQIQVILQSAFCPPVRFSSKI